MPRIQRGGGNRQTENAVNPVPVHTGSLRDSRHARELSNHSSTFSYFLNSENVKLAAREFVRGEMVRTAVRKTTRGDKACMPFAAASASWHGVVMARGRIFTFDISRPG